jgi:hypothetical protein
MTGMDGLHDNELVLLFLLLVLSFFFTCQAGTMGLLKDRCLGR